MRRGLLRRRAAARQRGTHRHPPAPSPLSRGVRRSSITLPSLGRLPGGDQGDVAAQPGDVADRLRHLVGEALGRAVGLDPQRHPVVGHRRPRRPAARARSRGWRRTISATCDGCTNMPRTLVDWSARPSQPRMRWLVRPVGQAPGEHRREVAGGEADQRVVGIERRHDELADLAVGDRVAGARAHDLDEHAFVDDQALARARSRRRPGRGRPCRSSGRRRCRARRASRAAPQATPRRSATPWRATAAATPVSSAFSSSRRRKLGVPT